MPHNLINFHTTRSEFRALEANTSASYSRANGEDDADDEFADIDFLDHCVQDVFEDYTD